MPTVDVLHVFKECKASYKITDSTVIDPKDPKVSTRGFYATAMKVIKNAEQVNPLYTPFIHGGQNLKVGPFEKPEEAVENLAVKLAEIEGVSTVPMDKTALELAARIERAKRTEAQISQSKGIKGSSRPPPAVA